MATAKNFHETCAARGHAHADRRRGGAPQARIYIATLLLFLTTLGLLYVVLFVSGDSQPSLWAVMLLRILAFLLPVYLIVQARAAGRAPTGPGTLWPSRCPRASSCRRAPRAGPPQAPAPSGLPAARVPRRAGARRGPGPHRPRHPLAFLLPVHLVVQARAHGALRGPGPCRARRRSRQAARLRLRCVCRRARECRAPVRALHVASGPLAVRPASVTVHHRAQVCRCAGVQRAHMQPHRPGASGVRACAGCAGVPALPARPACAAPAGRGTQRCVMFLSMFLPLLAVVAQHGAPSLSSACCLRWWAASVGRCALAPTSSAVPSCCSGLDAL